MVVGVGELDGSGTTCTMQLFEMQLNGAPPRLVSTLKMPVPDPSRPHQYLGRGWSLTAPIVIGKMLYCGPGVLWGGLAEFPLDVSAPQLRTPKTDPKMPVAEIDVLGAAEGKLFAFNSSWEESGIFMFDPANEQWTTLASCRRSERTSYLDYIFQYVDSTVYDAPRHRLLLTMRQDGLPRDHPLKAGLYAVDLHNYAISKVVAFLYNAPVAMDSVTPSRLWFVFPLFDEVSRIYEFNPDTNLWHMVLNRKPAFAGYDIDAKAMDDPKMGPARSNTNIQLPKGLDPSKVLIPGNHNVFPPYMFMDGWLWTFDPFGRVSLDGKQRQEFPEVEPRAKTNYFRTYHNSNTLSFLPDRHQVLYGDSHSLWLLDMPKTQGGPPPELPGLLPQAADGSIEFPAAAADLVATVGSPMKIVREDKPVVGYWSNPNDYVLWQAQVDKPGDFEVWLDYSCDSKTANSQFNLSVGDQSLTGTVAATANWDDFKIIKLGTIHIDKPGVAVVTVTPTKKPGQFVMNLRGITLKRPSSK